MNNSNKRTALSDTKSRQYVKSPLVNKEDTLSAWGDLWSPKLFQDEEKRNISFDSQ